MRRGTAATRVVITGMGVVSPIGIGRAAYWDGLVRGRTGVGRISAFDPQDHPCQIAAEVRGFDAEQFVAPKTVRRSDRFTQLALAAARMAIDDARLDASGVDLDRCGVVVGSGIGGLGSIEAEHRVLQDRGPGRVSPFLIPMMIANIAGGEIAIAHGFRGPNYAVSSACASSNHAIGASLRHLQRGEAEVMICGGAEAPITPLCLAGFCRAGALTTAFNDDPGAASRPFDARRSGFVMGEGAGIVVLETLAHAVRRGAPICAELAGFASTDDAFHITQPDPEGNAAARAMELALADADLRPEQIDYLNAHGTSTPLNDRFETAAIKRVFGAHARQLAISSTKSMTGHLLGAAGAVELVATVSCIQSGTIHPTINQDHRDPDCDLDYVPNQARRRQVDCAISSSLGFGGHNSTVVVRRAQA
ncbi:MAG TPA: beta-ketoacyl-ACP synthase II [Polyangia bacterium]|nr:beta-ketoacyl-ACP synthase II [Polyangia bacterium]